MNEVDYFWGCWRGVRPAQISTRRPLESLRINRTPPAKGVAYLDNSKPLGGRMVTLNNTAALHILPARLCLEFPYQFQPRPDLVRHRPLLYTQGAGGLVSLLAYFRMNLFSIVELEQ